jgi:hypothetical protein
MKRKNSNLGAKIFPRIGKRMLFPRVKEGKILQQLKPDYIEAGHFFTLGWELSKEKKS